MSTRLDDGLEVFLAPKEEHGAIDILANKPHQKSLGFMKASNFQLGIVEFDDQGRCYDRDQLDKISARIEELRFIEKDVILLVFVHGWKHDARSEDANLTSFRQILKRTSIHEITCAGVERARLVMGIFVGWRGLTAHGAGDFGADTTFWGRQDAAHRVATGSVRELFGRLRHYRNSRLKGGGSPLLVLAGHSFGGMIVFSALAQSLIEAASLPEEHIVPGFADLVLLVNPAIEGARYLPIFDLIESATFRARTDTQLPVFICIQAENDQPVGTWFPVGNFKNRLEEATIGDLEKRCVTHAIGFIVEYRTHQIAGPSGGNPFALTPSEIRQRNPYWIVSANKEVIDNHGGIWQDPFVSFLGAVLFQHVNLSRESGTTDASKFNGPAPLADGPNAFNAVVAGKAAAASASGNLADFARQIGPILLD